MFWSFFLVISPSYFLVHPIDHPQRFPPNRVPHLPTFPTDTVAASLQPWRRGFEPRSYHWVLRPRLCSRCLRLGIGVWLVVSNPLKNIVNLDDYSQYMEKYAKIKKVPNHQPGVLWRLWLCHPASLASQVEIELDIACATKRLRIHNSAGPDLPT